MDAILGVANTEVAGDMAASAMIALESPWANGRCPLAGKGMTRPPGLVFG